MIERHSLPWSLLVGVLIALTLALGGARPAEAADSSATATVFAGQVRLSAAAAGMAVEYSPGFSTGGVDTFVRLRSLSADPIVAGAGCATGADGWVSCGDHASTGVQMSGAPNADNTMLYAPGGNVALVNVVISGGGGNDVVVDGSEQSVIFAGGGEDYVDGGGGDDDLNGEAGNDLLRGGPGANVINGGDGDDLLEGGPDGDVLSGQGGDDVVNGGSGSDIVLGGDGNDTVVGADTPGTVMGGAGTDACDVLDLSQGGTARGCEVLLDHSDQLLPVVGVSAPTPGERLAVGASVASGVTCSDAGGSGVLVCRHQVLVGTGRGNAAFAAGAADHAGNLAFALVSYEVDFVPAQVPGALPPSPPSAPAASAQTVPALTPAVFTIDRRLPYVSPTRLKPGRRAYAKLGRWKPRRSYGLRYQWQLCDDQGQGCADIPGARGRGLVLTQAMAGHRLRFAVTAQVHRGAPVSTISQLSAVVQGTTPVNVTPPRISGRPRLGKTLFAKKGVWNPRGGYAYQWLRCDASGGACEPIPGATRVTWRATLDDVDHTLKVQVTAKSRTDRTTAVALSSATAVITD